jgi:uncharacterized protein
MSEDKLSQLSEVKYINIETYRKNGLGVRTPIWFIIHQGLIYFRSDEKSGKVKRLRNNPHVKIAPCDIRGNVKGEWFDGKIYCKFGRDINCIFYDKQEIWDEDNAHQNIQ